MFRMFEREKLKLVPVITLNGPLPGIDPTGPAKLVDYNGQALPAEGAQRCHGITRLPPRFKTRSSESLRSSSNDINTTIRFVVSRWLADPIPLPCCRANIGRAIKQRWNVS